MSFSEKAKLTALAIVHIFETSKPFGDYSAVAVLNDGAGVSYGINQFTHRSGSLLKVVNTYLGMGGSIGANAMTAAMPLLRDTSAAAIHKLAGNRLFKDALKFAAGTDEMKLAQQQIAENFYLTPAIDACEGSNFVLPLSLAVIYDSINHGSFGKIRDRVSAGDDDERRWITEYVRRRDAWLESIPRLAVTDYRTDFFLAQIARGNWNLDLPLNVHGHRLTDAEIAVSSQQSAVSEATPLAQPPTQNAENIVNVEADKLVPDNFVPETKEVTAAAPTGFMAKLKMQGAAIIAFIGGGAGLKEWLGVSISAETVGLLKVLLPTVLGLGFVGFLVWFVAEKIVGFKTMKLQADIATDPKRHDLVINAAIDMENSPWLDPRFLVLAIPMAVAIITWLLRGEFKSNANSTRQEEYEELMNERVVKVEGNLEKVKAAFYSHQGDTRVHHNEAMFDEFRKGLERRFNTLETTLTDIKGLIIQNHKDR